MCPLSRNGQLISVSLQLWQLVCLVHIQSLRSIKCSYTIFIPDPFMGILKVPNLDSPVLSEYILVTSIYCSICSLSSWPAEVEVHLEV